VLVIGQGSNWSGASAFEENPPLNPFVGTSATVESSWTEPAAAPLAHEPVELTLPPTAPEPDLIEPSAFVDQSPDAPVAEPPGWSELQSWSEPAGWSEPEVAETPGSRPESSTLDDVPFNPPRWDVVPSEAAASTEAPAWSIEAEPPTSDANRQLDELFNQLDFGPPPAAVLEAAGSFAEAPGQGLALPGSAAPLRVELPSDQPQRLPAPTPPWSGWIKPQA
jgi:hypothetical protein